MGRMADARKRARQASGGDVPPRRPEKPAPEPAPSESSPPAAVALPPAGLAEDVLRQLDEAPAAAAPETVPPGTSEPVSLPSSGLAEEVLPGGSMPGSHGLSFFATPAREQRAAVEATEHLATFFLDREEYGVDVRQVQEIRRMSEVTSVPRAPAFVRGVINLRGQVLPVLDLKRKLGLGEVLPGRATRILVVRVNERLLGLLVDGASQVLKIGVSRIDPPPEEVVDRGEDYIRGVAKLEDRLIILVDLGRLLSHELRAAGAPAETRAAEESDANS